MNIIKTTVNINEIGYAVYGFLTSPERLVDWSKPVHYQIKLDNNNAKLGACCYFSSEKAVKSTPYNDMPQKIITGASTKIPKII